VVKIKILFWHVNVTLRFTALFGLRVKGLKLGSLDFFQFAKGIIVHNDVVKRDNTAVHFFVLMPFENRVFNFECNLLTTDLHNRLF
jgi:hypothetical protein